MGVDWKHQAALAWLVIWLTVKNRHSHYWRDLSRGDQGDLLTHRRSETGICLFQCSPGRSKTSHILTRLVMIAPVPRVPWTPQEMCGICTDTLRSSPGFCFAVYHKWNCSTWKRRLEKWKLHFFLFCCDTVTHSATRSTCLFHSLCKEKWLRLWVSFRTKTLLQIQTS